MDKLISMEEALQLQNPMYIDLRSPLEYEDAHIPGAVNIPLLEDDERTTVGTAYKEESPQLALDKGFAFVAPRLPKIHEQIKALGKNRPLILYCWRGGMRSRSLSEILSLLNAPHYRLIGGYKAFRQTVNEFFDKPFSQEIIVVHGLTGVGKTELLLELRKGGYPAIDLEGLANNRGSVFGHIGLSSAPSQKQFEGLLFMEIMRLRTFPRLVVECESRRVGARIIPESFFDAMQKGRKILLYDSMENRIDRLIATYVNEDYTNNTEQLFDALSGLKQRLGQKKTVYLNNCLAQKNYHDFVERILVDYYDPLYRYPDKPSCEYELCLNAAVLPRELEKLKKIL